MGRNVKDCMPRISQLMEGVMMIAGTQRLIDDMLISDYRKLPDACVPELFRDSDEPATESCPIEGEVRSLDSKRRQWAKEQLSNLSDEFTLYSLGEDDYARLAMAVREEAEKLPVQSEEPLTHLPGMTELVSENIYKMFSLFDDCMKEG